MSSDNLIGEYIRARRDLVRPEDVGSPDLGRRRVPGLRREEVAMLAGVSSDYWVRLAQGRDQHPSEQVLDALARAQQLGDDASAHLRCLGSPPARRRHKSLRPERVPPSIQQLVESWSETPACVLGCYMDVLAPTRRRRRWSGSTRWGKTASAPPSSTSESATCSGTGSGSPRAPWRNCGRWSAPTSTTLA